MICPRSFVFPKTSNYFCGLFEEVAMRASEYEPFINDKKEWISDKYFTQQRLAGVNPMSLRRVTFHGASKGQ